MTVFDSDLSLKDTEAAEVFEFLLKSNEAHQVTEQDVIDDVLESLHLSENEREVTGLGDILFIISTNCCCHCGQFVRIAWL